LALPPGPAPPFELAFEHGALGQLARHWAMCAYGALSRHSDDEALTRQLLQVALAAQAWAKVQQLP